MTAAQVADALGVRPATVYAYVSRGILQRTTTISPDGQRISLFDRDEVLALATQRARPRAGVIGTLIESDVTELDPRGRLALRGTDVADLATRTFEESAAVVWQEPAAPWAQVAPALVAAVDRGLPETVTGPADRILLAVTLAASVDEHRADLDRSHVLLVARNAIRLAVRALGGPPRPGETIAIGLWRALTGTAPSEQQRAALESALVVLMDHELAASTLAARVAAGTHADPWMSLLAGLAALQGPRHGRASRQAIALLRRWLDEHVVEDPVPAGFGHKVYEGVDPRAEVVLDRVATMDPALADEVDALVIAVARDHSVLPNVDLALAALAVAADLPDGATEAIFMVARMVGLAAHILEEYPHGLRYRPRAVSAG